MGKNRTDSENLEHRRCCLFKWGEHARPNWESFIYIICVNIYIYVCIYTGTEVQAKLKLNTNYIDIYLFFIYI